MNKNMLKKIGIVILIMIVLRIFLIVILNQANINSSHYINYQGNKVAIGEGLGSTLYTINGSGETNAGNKFISISSDIKQEFSLLVDNLTFLHKISVNDEVVNQNYNKNDPFYSSNYAYKVVEIESSDYIDNTVQIKEAARRSS